MYETLFLEQDVDYDLNLIKHCSWYYAGWHLIIFSLSLLYSTSYYSPNILHAYLVFSSSVVNSLRSELMSHGRYSNKYNINNLMSKEQIYLQIQDAIIHIWDVTWEIHEERTSEDDPVLPWEESKFSSGFLEWHTGLIFLPLVLCPFNLPQQKCSTIWY